MRVATLGVMGVAGFGVFLVGTWLHRPEAGAQAPFTAPPGQLITLAADVDATRQQLVIIDPQTRAMGVYHLDRASGVITLKSVRNIHWDLQMDEFNGMNPSPREIRSLLENR